MANYEYDYLSFKDLDRIKIPRFQRGLVWTAQKRRDLITTLHKDYPFGSLLVSPERNSATQLRLLDGQQRLSTIRDYQKNKVAYWHNLNPEDYDAALQQINDALAQWKQSITEKRFDELLDEKYELADWTDEYNDVPATEKKDLRDIVNGVRKQIKAYVDLDQLKIPVIKFIGDEGDLPEVYENLNKGGTPLTKYEIFNAVWSDDTVLLPKTGSAVPAANEILQNVKNYYNDMAKNGSFELDDFSEDELTRTRKINLAEFGRALGQFVVERMPALVATTESKANNELGFGLLGIATDTDNKNIPSLSSKAALIQQNISDILLQSNMIARKLNDIFAMLKQNIAHSSKKNAKKSPYATGLSTSFKTLSYFAALWGKTNDEMNASIKYIPQYYVFDFLNGAWTGHGDKRLGEYYQSVNKRNYQRPVPIDEFRRSFSRWLAENTGVKTTFSKQIQALITIHSNFTYLAGTIPNGEDYEFEHIIPKARILTYDSKPSFVHLSSLGNGMFLPKRTNREKKDQTIYENMDRWPSNIPRYTQFLKDSDYPERIQFQRIFANLRERDFDGVNSYIDERAKRVADAIVDGLMKSM
ncbi:DUF262 domain-containing protein [Schleiferilactobacillus harbinensis]|jgi:hypothetical protein|uniref:DUF262 domain-containing protein n=1 Tax=Schleiferilactobacillus harbinensis TaxID=304207 RepID=A0ABU7T1X2_9LACO